MSVIEIVLFLAGAFVAALATWLACRSTLRAARLDIDTLRGEKETALLSASKAQGQLSHLERLEEHVISLGADLEAKQKELADLRVQAAETETRLSAEREALARELERFSEMEASLKESFKALSSDAIKANNTSFLQLAKETFEKHQKVASADLDLKKLAITNELQPVAEAVKKISADLATAEKNRVGTASELKAVIEGVQKTQENLRGETARLVTALRSPSIRGRWGELQLKKVVELAGMVDHCDFVEQDSTRSAEGSLLRPDLVVRLAGNRTIVIDSKTPLAAYVDAVEAASDGDRERHLKHHAEQVRGHIQKLSQKSYWNQFDETPDFVVMFLPGESLFSAALQYDSSLIEFGVEQNVIPASPTTLIALLRAAAYGWREERIAENARRIAELGQVLHDRLATLAEHFAAVGSKLDAAVAAYNKTVGTFEGRVLVSARRFLELGVPTDKGIEELSPVETQARALLPAPVLAGN